MPERITAGTISRTSGSGVTKSPGMPRPLANKSPAPMAGYDSERDADGQGQPSHGADLPIGDHADLPPGQAECPQHGEVTAAAAGHDDELPEHREAENGSTIASTVGVPSIRA